MSLQDIYHFVPLDDRLLTGGMPTADQLGDVAGAGVETVINLALPDAPRALQDEATVVRTLGMEYIGIPVQWEAPTHHDLEMFMDAMDAHRAEKLFVHCQANYRVSGFMLLYRVLRLGWEREPAMKELRQIWNPADYPVWQKFIEDNLPAR